MGWPPEWLARDKPALVRAAGVALLCATLTQLVVHAAEFSHDRRFLTLLGEEAGPWWLFVALWLAALVSRLRLAPVETRAWLLEARPFALTLAGLLFVVTTPFTNAYFTHLTHPALAVVLVWVLAPAITRVRQRLRQPAAEAEERLGGQPWAAAAVVFLVVFVQSYRRHWWFGSGGKDLGLFHQSVWLLSQGAAPENTVMGMSAFADHLELVDLLAAPLQWPWPSAGALLLFQAALVGLATVPVFDLARRALGSAAAGWALAAVYLLGADLQQAVMFDWNPTTCGVTGLPWVVWFFARGRAVGFALSLAFVALAKENLVLYGLGLSVALAVRPERRRWALAAAAALALLFVVELQVVFPLLRPEGFRHWRFAELGDQPWAMLREVVRSPYRAFALLFTPGNKIDGLLLPFSTVAFVCWLSPRWLFAFAPMILERFWSDHANRWWGHHYGAGIGVAATLAAIEGLARIRAFLAGRQRQDLLPVAVLGVLVSCLLVGTLGRFGPAPLWVWRQPYYASAADRADAAEVLQVIPDAASVAAQNHLLPHLSARRAIFQLVQGDGQGPVPVHAEFVARVAEYVAIDLQQSAWPREPGFARHLGLELLGRGYGVVACRGQAIVLRRGAAGQPCAALAP